MCKDKQLDSVPILASLPQDVTFKITSLLQVRDLCALGCCSRFCRDLCFSDCFWEPLVRTRWPLLALAPSSSSSSSSSTSATSTNPKKWRKFYFERHVELGLRARTVEMFLKACSPSESLEVGDYLKAVDTLVGLRFGFEDIQRYLFNPKMNVLINLVGLHYCLSSLGIRGENLLEVLRTCEISDRRVVVKWLKLGRWLHGYRMRDEFHSRWVSLADLATQDDGNVLGVLRRAIHEVLRVEISAVGHTTASWSYQLTHRLQ